MNIPLFTTQNPIECSTILERDEVINDPRYKVAGLSVSVAGVLYWLNADLATWAPQSNPINSTGQRTNPQYVYGQLTAAKMICDPATVWDVGLVGDSRSSISVDQQPASVAYDGLLGGQNGGVNYLGLGGLASTTAYSQSPSHVPVTTPLGNLSTLTFGSLTHTILSAGTSPGSYNTARLYYNSLMIDATSWVAVKPQLLGRAVTIKILFRTGTTGLSTSDLHISVRRGPGGTGEASSPTYTGSVMGTYSPAPGWVVGSVTIPNTWDWATDPVMYLECWYTFATAVRTETISVVDMWVESCGASVLNWASAGLGLPHWLDNTLYSSALWTDLFPLYGTNRALWIDLGTNNTLGWTAAQHAAGLQQLIARFRAGSPGGPVIISTAYASSADLPRISPYYRDAAIAVAQTDPLVTVLDTHMAMPSYAEAVSLGYYGGTPDGVHYVKAGRDVWEKTRWKLLSAAANA